MTNKIKKSPKLLIGIVGGIIILLIIIALCLVEPTPKAETIKETMRDAVLHDSNKVLLFGLEVNPGLKAAVIVSCIMLVFALIVRVFVIPKFTVIPGKFQALLETWVSFFSGLANTNSHHYSGFIGKYIFAAGSYLAVSTIFELMGVQALTTKGHHISLPAPLSDINGAISIGVLSYSIILFGGMILSGYNGVLKTKKENATLPAGKKPKSIVSGALSGSMKGAVGALKDFSLPISMSFRLFGALLSGALVTELVYYYAQTSYVLPVFVAILFTCLHAIIQTYVLTMLCSVFFGETTEP